ncbi:hypothetical protein NX862_04270 [Rhodobacter sp. KR11]|uniref:hypothetical protein n=1 Tax=Rhodobacter sp. KR11 TaxID=2974588 RepID=UPI002222F286|nr:hypothetical protein [Rhodobacter sp. KR11]MCW1917959.1 hypothetical protein [Rhodobacter sp. KR11]
MRKMTKMAAVVATMAAAPVAADPVVGLGLTFWFGSGQTQTGVGLRVFSDDQNESVVGSVGVDYILQGGAIRPTLGIAYLQDNAYVGADLGFDMAGGPIQFGAGIGVTNTAEEDPVIATTPPLLTDAPEVPPDDTGNDGLGNDSLGGGEGDVACLVACDGLAG